MSFRKATALTLASLALLAGMAGTASASTTHPTTHTSTARPAADGYTMYQNLATQRCMDDSNSYGWRTYPCNQGSWDAGYQKIYHHQWNDGTERLMGQVTGLCLRDYGNGYVAHAACDSSQAESWYHTYNNGLRLQNQATGWCLDDSDQYGFRTYPCNGGAYQSW